MADKVVAYLIQQGLKYLTPELVAKALVSVLRGICGSLKDVAARTSSPIDDSVVAALSQAVDAIAAQLKV